MSRLSNLLPVNSETLSDMVGVAVIGLGIVGLLWLPALTGI